MAYFARLRRDKTTGASGGVATGAGCHVLIWVFVCLVFFVVTNPGSDGSEVAQ